MVLKKYFYSLCFSVLLLISALQAYPDNVTVTSYLSNDKVKIGSSVRIAFKINIANGWHINTHAPKLDYLIPTVLEFESKPGIIVTEILYPKGKSLQFSFADEPIEVFENDVTIFCTIKFSDKLPIQTDTVKAKLNYQACDNATCFAPSSIDLNIPIELVSDNQTIASINSEIFSRYNSAELSSGVKNELADVFNQKGTFLAFLTIFIIGLALNLTPCVYPMLSVTVSLFGSNREANLVKVFFKAVVYVLGIATMYSLLGVTAAISGGLFGNWLQNPFILGGIALLLFLLALSSFGVYQLRLPYWLTNKLGGTSGTNLIAVYLSGLVVGVFAAPCVGPPVIALLTLVAAKADVAFGFWAFFVLALGLGAPYLILGTFSGLLKKIPRSGTWLVWVEHLFGIILVGAGLFYLLLAVAPKESIYAIPITLIGGGIYLGFIDISLKLKPFLTKLKYMFGAALIIWGIVFLNDLSNKGIEWAEYSEQKFIDATENGQIVILDFSADWCIPCIKLEMNTFTDKKLISKTKDVLKLKVDLTHFDSPESEAIRNKFKISGVPTIIFIKSDGTEATDYRITGFVTADEFLSAFEQANK